MTQIPRIAMVVDRFPMLSETFVVTQTAALVAKGFDVEIFASDYAPEGAAHADVIRHGLLERTRYASKLTLFRLATRLGRPYRLCSWLRSRAVRASVSDQQGFDVVLCHFGDNGVRAVEASRAGRMQGPVWTFFHGYDLSRYLQSGSNPYSELFKYGDLFLPISDFWARKLEELGAPPEKILVHRMGVDCREIEFRRRPPKDVSTILSVCRLVEKKGIEYALRALGRLRDVRPDLQWKYQIAGDGPLRDDLEKLSAELGIAERVTFLGSTPHGEVKALLKDADIFVLPSIVAADGDMEGIPVSLMEAMAAGLPVVSTTHSGIPELVVHGETGLLSPERDSNMLASNIERILTDDNFRDEIVGKARAKVEKDFNLEKLDNRLAEMIVAQADRSASETRAA